MTGEWLAWGREAGALTCGALALGGELLVLLCCAAAAATRLPSRRNTKADWRMIPELFMKVISNPLSESSLVVKTRTESFQAATRFRRALQ